MRPCGSGGGTTARALRNGASALVLTAITIGVGATAQARLVEKIVALVGDDVILDSEIKERSAPFMAEIAAITNQPQRAARAAALQREMLDRLIDEKLILQQATEMKLSVTSEEIDRTIEQIKKDQGLSDQQLREALGQQGMNMASYRQELRKQLVRMKIIQIAVNGKVNVSDTDVQSYYDRNMKSGANVQVRASHIFIGIPDNADTAIVLERQTLATKLLERINAGEDFSKVAKEASEDANTRNEGGDLGYFGKDMLPKPIEELVFSMRVGEVRGPVRAERGFHVIKLVDRKTNEVKPLAEMREQLREQLRQKDVERQTKNYISDLRKKTLVEIRL